MKQPRRQTARRGIRVSWIVAAAALRAGTPGSGKIHAAAGASDDLHRVAGHLGVGETTVTPTRPRSGAGSGAPAHASRVLPARSFPGGRPYPVCRNRSRYHHRRSTHRAAPARSVPGVTEPDATGPSPRRHRPARRAPARRAGRPPRAAPPEHRRRRGDRATRRRRCPGRAPSRCTFPAAAPGTRGPGRRLRAAVLLPAHARAGKQNILGEYSILA